MTFQYADLLTARRAWVSSASTGARGGGEVGDRVEAGAAVGREARFHDAARSGLRPARAI